MYSQLIQVTTAALPAFCDSSTILAQHIKQFFPKIPQQLTVDSTWSDSTVTNDCHAFIPTTSVVTAKYTVLGDTTYDTLSALHLRRSHTFTTKGEGNKGQHRIFLTAVGTGTTDLYLNTADGQLLSAFRTDWMTNINVTTSGRTERFSQHAVEHMVLTKVFLLIRLILCHAISP